MIAYIVNTVIISFLTYSIYKKYSSSDFIKYFFPALGIKLLAGVGIGFLYFYYYGYGDTITYHEDAIKLSNIAYYDVNEYLKVLFGQSHSFDISQFISYDQSRAFFFTKILSVVHLLSGQNYWISGIYFSFFSFIGFWILANSLIKYFPISKLGVVATLFFFPSVIFWSSGIMKESITMGALLLAIKFLIDWLLIRKLNWKEIMLCILLLLLVWNLKYYYLGVFLAVTIPLILTDVFVANNLMKINKYVIYTFFFIIQIGVISLMHPNFNLSNILQVIVENHDLYVLKSRPDQFIYFADLRARWSSISYNFPLAVWSGLFRIGVWESNNILEYILGFENLVILILAISSIFQLPKLKENPHGLLLIATIIYIVLLAGFLALSAPNFGTLARYKVGYLPIMILLITYKNPLVAFLKSKFMGKVEDIA